MPFPPESYSRPLITGFEMNNPQHITHNIAGLFKELQAIEKPEHLKEINPPAKKEAIEALEEFIGAKLPASYRRLLSIADGAEYPFMVGHHPFLSIEEVKRALKLQRELADELNERYKSKKTKADQVIRDVRMDPMWIPVFGGDGDYICLDLHPAEGGHRGQVIMYYHDDNTGPGYRANSLEQWFVQVLAEDAKRKAPPKQRPWWAAW